CPGRKGRSVVHAGSGIDRDDSEAPADLREDDVATRPPGDDLRRGPGRIRERRACDVGIQAEHRDARRGALDDEAAARDAYIRELAGRTGGRLAPGGRCARADDGPPRPLVVPFLTRPPADDDVRSEGHTP